jgi:hypothetical protein
MGFDGSSCRYVAPGNQLGASLASCEAVGRTSPFQAPVKDVPGRRDSAVLLDFSTAEKHGHTTDNHVDAYIAGLYQKAFELEHSAGTS